MSGITILGSTGSIGQNTLDVVARHPNRFNVIGLSAKSNIDLLFHQCLRFKPLLVTVNSLAAAKELEIKLREAKLLTEVVVGEEGLITIATHPKAEYVMAAIVGAAGLIPTLAAVKAKKRVLLANKEALVMSGALFMCEVQKSGAVLLPIDSEHNALFQCMPKDFVAGNKPQGVKRLILTASGGPFLKMSINELATVTPDQACAHPKWIMGRKISADSATMMNKALEIIEAHWLFNMPPEKIDVLIHPQSIVHSLIEYEDSSLLAQLGTPDMRISIAYALAWPERIYSGVNPVDLITNNHLEFMPACHQRFPALNLAYQALKAGGTAPAILNAANEIAVQAFLDRQIAFTDIVRINEEVLAAIPNSKAENLSMILQADQNARDEAKLMLEKCAL